MYHCIQSLIW